VNIVDVFYVLICNRTMKPVVIVLSRGRRNKERDGEGEPN
jgi:hypothetical protein